VRRDDWEESYAEFYGELYKVADDHEADVLEHLAVKAGFLWRCKIGSCHGYVNWRDVESCENCGEPRGTEEDNNEAGR
jgi:hypothetical protein